MSENDNNTVNRRFSTGNMGSVRFRLLAIALVPTIVILPVLLIFAMIWWITKFDNLLISKVNGDLTIARQYLGRIIENSNEQIRALGDSRAFADILRSNARSDIARYLDKKRSDLLLDILYIVNADGEIFAARPTHAEKVDVDRWPVVASALKGRGKSAIDVFDARDLRKVSPLLERRARVELVATHAAVPTNRTVETRGMIIHAATPIRHTDGRWGALVGGKLLNHNLEFIDTINDLVYEAASLPKGSRGTTTLFLDDVRISTNVRLFGESRAIGTRVSRSVREAVLGRGRVWLDRAYVVNDWYISAYEPIEDSRGKRIGMLYVGFLESPFETAKLTTLFSIAAAFLLVTVVSVPMFLRWARDIFKPLEKITQTISRVEGGDLNARTGLRYRGDEIGAVAYHFDELLNQIQDRDQELRDAAKELNRRVESRTRELRSANENLTATTQQLVMSGKLAAIGEITACVAHEINNPIAVIQGNLDVLRESPGVFNETVKGEFALIDEQIYRINLIMTKLLQFAKPDEFAGYADRQLPDEVLTDCLLLSRHLLSKSGVTVERDARSQRRVLINQTELQQVVLNLIVNALHAMPNSGTLGLRTHDLDKNGTSGVAIEISDTGEGMSAAVAKKIFEPFFTTKKGEGTGLGLSISQTIVRRWGGSLTVDSDIGHGTKFTIWLPETRVAAE